MINLNKATLSTFTWSTSEQVYPFEKDSSGRTLYCKELDFGAFPNNGVKSVAHGITFSPFSFSKIHSITGRLKDASDTWSSFMPYAHPGAGWSVLTYIDATNLSIMTGPTNQYTWNSVMRLIYAK